MATDATAQTEATLAHHLEAVGLGVLEEILKDYTDQSVLYTQDGPVEGLAALREYFEVFLHDMPEGMMKSFRIVRQDVVDEFAFIVWTAPPVLALATSTFLVRDRRIAVQTFAAHATV
jgi:hypothetical protein